MTRETESALMRRLRIVSFVDIQNEIQFHNILKILSHFCSQITALELTKCTISDKKVLENNLKLPALKELGLCDMKGEIAFLNIINLMTEISPYLDKVNLSKSTIKLPLYTQSEIILPNINIDKTLTSVLIVKILMPTLEYITFDNSVVAVPRIDEIKLLSSEILKLYSLKETASFPSILSLGNILQPKMEVLKVEKDSCNIPAGHLNEAHGSRNQNRHDSPVLNLLSQDKVMILASLETLAIHSATNQVNMSDLFSILMLRANNLRNLEICNCDVKLAFENNNYNFPIDFRKGSISNIRLERITNQLSFGELLVFLSQMSPNLTTLAIAHVEHFDMTDLNDESNGIQQTKLHYLEQLYLSGLFIPSSGLTLAVYLCPKIKVLHFNTCTCEVKQQSDNLTGSEMTQESDKLTGSEVSEQSEYPTSSQTVLLILDGTDKNQIVPTLKLVNKFYSAVATMELCNIELLDIQDENFSMKALKKLCLKNINRPIFMSNVIDFTRNFPNLIMLDIISCHIEETIEYSLSENTSSVQDLNLIKPKQNMQMPAILGALTDLCKGLRCLAFKECDEVIINSNALKNVGGQKVICPNLETLDLADSKVILPASHTEIEKMTGVSIPMIENYSVYLFSLVAKTCKNVDSLCIDGCKIETSIDARAREKDIRCLKLTSIIIKNATKNTNESSNLSIEDVLKIVNDLCPGIKKIIIKDTSVSNVAREESNSDVAGSSSSHNSSFDRLLMVMKLCPGLDELIINDNTLKIPSISEATKLLAADILHPIDFDFSLSVSLHDLMVLAHFYPKLEIYTIKDFCITPQDTGNGITLKSPLQNMTIRELSISEIKCPIIMAHLLAMACQFFPALKTLRLCNCTVILTPTESTKKIYPTITHSRLILKELSFDSVGVGDNVSNTRSLPKFKLIPLLEMLASICRSDIYQDMNLRFVKCKMDLARCTNQEFLNVCPKCLIMRQCTPLNKIEEFVNEMPVIQTLRANTRKIFPVLING